MKSFQVPAIFFKKKFALAVYIIITLVISLLQYAAGPKTFEGFDYTHYNNYVIFKQSFFHLIHNLDLYLPYPEDHWDYYKYSPSFALLMFPVAYLPDWLGLTIWNLINSLVLFWALSSLKLRTPDASLWVIWFVLPELIISLQNSQSNGLVAGLIIGSFCFLERNNFIVATLFIVLSVFIKVFGIVAFLLCLFFKSRIKSVLSGTVFMAVFAFLPLCVLSFDELMHQYKSWVFLLGVDQFASTGLSVLGWLQSWFDLIPPKNLVTLFGIVLLCLPLINFKSYKSHRYRLLFLSSMLIWVVIFNHKAESPTFIIAICGAAIWYFLKPRSNVETAFLIIAFILSSLSPTDIFPRYLREHFVVPYTLKVVPLIVIWVRIIIEQMAPQYQDEHPSLV